MLSALLPAPCSLFCSLLTLSLTPAPHLHLTSHLPLTLVSSSQANGGWSMGVRTVDCRAGAISVLAPSPCGARLYAGTDDGVVLGWDTRKLGHTLCVVRAGRAVCAGEGSSGVIALSHHPALRHTLCAQVREELCAARCTHCKLLHAPLAAARC